MIWKRFVNVEDGFEVWNLCQPGAMSRMGVDFHVILGAQISQGGAFLILDLTWDVRVVPKGAGRAEFFALFPPPFP